MAHQRDGSGYILVLTLHDIAGPGTYPMGMGPTVVGGSGVFSNAGGGWAALISGSATGTKTVTNGDFDLEVKLKGTVGPLPDYAESKVTATLYDIGRAHGS